VSESTPPPSAAAQALLPWHRDLATATLQQRSRWPQALLIAGRRGLGKRALALHFARALLCEAPRPDGDACAVCPGCLYVAAGAHPDLRLIEPLLSDEEGNVTVVDAITVDRIRELTAFTQL
jgi:DNA polymerase-3 subunit delta'